MAAKTGRKITMTWDGTAIAGVQEKGITLNGEPIDISADDSAGWRVLLDEAGERSVNISISGVIKGNVLRKAFFDEAIVEAVVITYAADGGSFTGDFNLASYSETGNYKEAVTFEAELQSTGAVTYTPPA